VTSEELDNLRGRRDEAVAKAEQLEKRPSELRAAMYELEQQGDIGAVDACEAELASLTSPAAAARDRASVLDALLRKAEDDLKQAEQAKAAAEGLRRHYARVNQPVYGPTTLENINRRLANTAAGMTQAPCTDPRP